MNLRRLQAAREDGFTLIELLIVIVILGILAGIVTFGVAQFRSDSTSAACKADVKNIETAIAAYKAKNPSGTPTVPLLVSGGYLKTTPSTTGSISGDNFTPTTAC